MTSFNFGGASIMKNIIFDLNGTLYQRNVLVNGSDQLIDTLRQKGYALTFVTNTDARATKDVHTRLLDKGLHILEEEVLTPVSAAKRFIQSHKNKTFHFLTHDDVINELSFAKQDPVSPDYVIIGDFSDKLSYETINQAFRMIKNGSQLIALSKTLWYKDVDGDSINTGAFVHMLETACNTNALLLGKPSVDFLQMALDRTGALASETIVIGDDIKTDIWGGHQLGATTVQVQTGVYDGTYPSHQGVSPDYIIKDVTQLEKLVLKI